MIIYSVEVIIYAALYLSIDICDDLFEDFLYVLKANNKMKIIDLACNFVETTPTGTV